MSLILRGIDLKKNIPLFNPLINLNRDLNHTTLNLTHNTNIVAYDDDITGGGCKNVEQEDQSDHSHYWDGEHNDLSGGRPG